MKFTEYLEEEGLHAIVARREELGESKDDGRELYSRYLKTLIQVGDVRDDGYGRIVGQLLEVVPEADPAACRPGDSLSVKILFEGKPPAGAQVSAHVHDSGEVHGQTLTTGADGRVVVKIDRKGSWLIHLVHMRRTEAKEADWESYWGGYTFGL